MTKNQDELFEEEYNNINSKLIKVVTSVSKDCENPDSLRILCLTKILAAAILHKTLNEMIADLNEMKSEDSIKVLHKILEKNIELNIIELHETIYTLVDDFLKLETNNIWDSNELGNILN